MQSKESLISETMIVICQCRALNLLQKENFYIRTNQTRNNQVLLKLKAENLRLIIIVIIQVITIFNYLGNSSSFENRDRNHKERISKLKAKDFVPPENQNRIRIVTKRQRPSKTMKPSM